ncbi:putative glycosyltransferase EpsF [Clostridium acetireducens DSM 10703]|uniref:Putative glycosyltransferase EpsF n=1 Tax=Clostridium acetireducens DSM 10703 TaxID=1121290 RepID=A0A1E8EYN2_9CLOT|nr:glycosyltransferase [Clostridium acetireducens]OFI05796.1 putative glycosyltransferase EpsF [Clostridium acetireducens DSM 10703]
MIYIKVLHIISGNDNGGGAVHVLNICRCPSFENKICCIGEGELYSKALAMGIITVKYSLKELIFNKLVEYVKKENIDILNFHGPKATFIHYFTKFRLKKPCVVTVHSDYRYDFLNNKIKHLFYTPISKISLNSFDYYACVSQYIKDLLESKEFYGDKIVVNNGIDIKNIKITKSRNEIRKEIGLSENNFTFVMVARMHPIKNHEKLLKTFKRLSNEFDNVKLLLVGDGELENQLKNQVNKTKLNDNVIFLGYRSNSLDYINASDVSLLISLNEGGAPPLVILESGIVKKPVICSKVGDMGRIISDKNGFLINPYSEDSLYEKMKLSYLMKNKLNLLGENLYNDVVKKFSLETFWNRYYCFYERILNTN